MSNSHEGFPRGVSGGNKWISYLKVISRWEFLSADGILSRRTTAGKCWVQVGHRRAVAHNYPEEPQRRTVRAVGSGEASPRDDPVVVRGVVASEFE